MLHQDFQTLSGLKKQGAYDFFLTDFKVFGYLIKNSFGRLIYFLIIQILMKYQDFSFY